MKKLIIQKIIFFNIIIGMPFINIPGQTSNTNHLILRMDKATYTISKDIYGNFAEHLGHCIYGGLWVGEKSDIPNIRGIRSDVVAALKDLSIPVLRWPGGCFADTYHWKDGVGPRESRPSIINVTWGGVSEDNSFGTHEFLDLCEQLGCDAYITGNVGSGSVREMTEWVEYLTSDTESPMTKLRKQNGRAKPWNVKYIGIGNEAWGCGGNMTPDFYSDLFRQYGTYVTSACPGLIKVASGASADDFNWTDVVMKNVDNRVQDMSLHYYTLPGDWTVKGSATNFTQNDWFTVLKKTLMMDSLIKKHISIMDKYNNNTGLVIDEWGTWYDVEPGTNPGFLFQQNTLRDALVAGINLNIFNNHADRVKMANIAQLINVLQSVILTKGSEMVLTPTYYVFKMFKVHQNATLIPIDIQCTPYNNGNESIPSINASASKDHNGLIHISLVNLDPNKDKLVTIELNKGNYKYMKGEKIRADRINAFNDFGKSPEVIISNFSSAKLKNNILEITLPSKSVVMIELSDRN